MKDKQGQQLSRGDTVEFYPLAGRTRKGEVRGNKVVDGGKVAVRLEGDPFAVLIETKQLARIHYEVTEKEEVVMGTATKPKAKELRNRAKALGIEDYEDMTRAQLEAAIEAAEEDLDEDEDSFEDDEDEIELADDDDEDEDEEDDEDEDEEEDVDEDEEDEEDEPVRTQSKKKGGKKVSKTKEKAKKGKAVKAAKSTKPSKAKASTNGTAENPFREGSNLFMITEQLKKGGKRSVHVAKLHSKMAFRPRKDKSKAYEVEIVNSRIDLVCRLLKNEHGWDVTRDGRGDDAKIKVSPS